MKIQDSKYVSSRDDLIFSHTYAYVTEKSKANSS